MLWKIDFSLGAGKPVEDIKGLRNSLEDALSAAREVLVEGCEKVLKSRVKQGRKYDSGVIREFSQQCAKAVELLEEQIAIDAVEKLKEYIGSEAGLTGEDIFDIVAAAGKQMILTAAPAQEDAESMRFCAECELCTSVDAILELLKKEICLLFDRLKNQDSGETERRPIRIAKQYIQFHYMEALTLETVASAVGFSSSYFSSLFKKETGTGFNEYLVKIRMEEAKKLLRDTEINIKDICVMVGYQDLKHYTATFRKYTGLKPGEYRKLYN